MNAQEKMEYETCCVTSVTSLGFCTISCENSPHTCENSTKPIKKRTLWPYKLIRSKWNCWSGHVFTMVLYLCVSLPGLQWCNVWCSHSGSVLWHCIPMEVQREVSDECVFAQYQSSMCLPSLTEFCVCVWQYLKRLSQVSLGAQTRRLRQLL